MHSPRTRAEHQADRIAAPDGSAARARSGRRAAKGEAQPLPTGLPTQTAAWLGGVFGHDLGDVRVHSGEESATRARAAGARALTEGADVHMDPRLVDPATPSGRRTLAHEVAHALQGLHPTRGGSLAAPSTVPAATSAPDDPAELEASAAADQVLSRTGRPRLTPSARVAGLAHRDIVSDAAGNPTGFEFRAGQELRLEFMVLAQRLLGGGTLHARGLQALHNEALKFHGTVDDHERMFMAGLTVPANAATLSGVRLVAGAAVTFPLATISANLRTVIDLGREPVPATVTRPIARGAAALARFDVREAVRESQLANSAAEAEILTRSGPFRASAQETIGFSRTRGVALSDVLTAMLEAASDSSPGDQAYAGAVYATAAAAGLPVAADLLAGRIKVDAVVPSAFTLIPGTTLASGARVRAFYVTVAQASGVKGDTIYVPTDFSVSDLSDRSAIVHELTHAREDLAAAGGRVTFTSTEQLEATAYRAQGRYLLDELAATPAAGRAAVISRLAGRAGALELVGMLIETLADRPRFEPIVVALAAALTPPVTAAAVAAKLRLGAARLTTEIITRIRAGYGLAPGARTAVDGLSGESLVSWIFRI